VKYPNNFIKVYNDTLYKPVLKKSNLNYCKLENVNTNVNNNNNINNLFEDNNSNFEGSSIQSFADLRKRISSFNLYSPIRSSVNFGNKIKSPLETHLSPFIHDIYDRLSFISSNSLPYISENDRYSSRFSNSYQELSDSYDIESNEVYNEMEFNNDQDITNILSYNNSIINSNDKNANNNYFFKENNYHPLNEQNIEVNSNLFHEIKMTEEKSLMNYFSNNKNYNKKSNNINSERINTNDFKNDNLFFNINKLNKNYKKYNLKENYLNSNQKKY